MEARRVLGLDEVQIELRLALRCLCLGDRLRAGAALLRCLNVVDEVDDRVHGLISEREDALLDRLGARLELLLGPAVTCLARIADVEQRAAHVVVADLERADAAVGHVAVGASDARARVDALVPGLELGVLGLQQLRACVGVRPILESDLLVVGVDLIDLEPVLPWIHQALLRTLEVILDMALAADVCAHLLARGVAVDVVVGDAL